MTSKENVFMIFSKLYKLLTGLASSNLKLVSVTGIFVLAGCAVTPQELREGSYPSRKFQTEKTYAETYRIVITKTQNCFPGAPRETEIYNDNRSASVAFTYSGVTTLQIDIQEAARGLTNVSMYHREHASSFNVANTIEAWLVEDLETCETPVGWKSKAKAGR